MSSWFSAWLPNFNVPSINLSLPSSLQGRFISFVLKKALGHLLAPGQLDLGQIESQIGSGFVQINDLELNCQAINTLLADLPVTLHDGFISSAVAKIPWPNPLTSTLGFSLDSLHLTFHLRPKAKDEPLSNVNLAESVFSVAESFIHDELTAQEEATLIQSIHGEPLSDSPHLPGSLDNDNPFKASPDENEDPEPETQEIDPSGVSVFATMIERLLARFEFDATNTKITLVHPGNMSFTIAVPSISYRGNSEGNVPTGASSASRLQHTVSISDLTVTARNLRVPSPASSVGTWTPSRQSPRPASSSSSLDEDTQMMMSQSLAYLPPRSFSPAESVASSLYESAVSDVRTSHGLPSSQASKLTPNSNVEADESPPLDQRRGIWEEDKLLAFGRSPAQIQLFTLPGVNGREELQLNVSLGVVASAIQAKHLQGVLCLLEDIATSQPRARPAAPSKPNNPSTPGPDINVVASARGIVLLLPLASSAPTSGECTAPDLTSFYERPLVPPTLNYSYFRLHVDNVQASVSRISDVVFGKSRSDARVATSFNTQITSEISIDDISLFQILKEVSSPQDGAELLASPVLIVDPHLPRQYSSPHYHPKGWEQCYDLPRFEVLDWTNTEHQVHGVKLSSWRTKGKVRHTGATGRTTDSEQRPPHAITFSIATTISSSPRKHHITTSVDVQMSPLHIFLDLGSLLKAQVLAFVGEVMEGRNSSPSPPSSPDSDDNPFDFGDKPLPRSQTEPDIQFSLDVRAVRIQARTPPPPLANPRSGTIVLDLNDIIVTNNPSTRSQRARFAEFGSFPAGGEQATEEHVLTVDFSRAVVACSLAGESVASSLVSVGSLAQNQDTAPGLDEGVELLSPRLRILRHVASHGSAHSFCVDIPSVYVDIWKSALDDVQYWIDDVSQLFDRTFNPNTVQHINLQSDDLEANLVGSRFFAKSRDNSVSSSTVSGEPLDKIIKLAISEVLIRAKVPRLLDGESQFFLVSGSDLQVSVGTRPEEINDETGIKVQISDLAIGMNGPTSTQCLFSMTSPRTVSSPNRPVLSLRFSSISLPGSSLKESIVKAVLSGFTLSINPDFSWVADLSAFVKSPPNTFESVIPSERTRVALKVFDGSIQLFANSHPGSFVAYLDDLDLKTDITGNATESVVNIGLGNLSVLLIDDLATILSEEARHSSSGVSHWKSAGFAPVGEVTDLLMTLKFTKDGKSMRVIVDDVGLRITLCTDTVDALNAFLDDFSTSLQPADKQRSQAEPDPTPVVSNMTGSGLMGSIDDLAFRKVPEIGPTPDMIEDDLPTNPNYLDESFGAAAGLRELRDEDFDDFGDEDDLHSESYAPSDGPGVISRIGGETIRMIRPEGIEVIDDFFRTLPPEPEEGVSVMDDAAFSLRLKNGDITLALYDGYDWSRTRKTIEDQAKAVRKRLTKIRQLVASGQAYTPTSEETGALLFNSVYVGLEDVDEMDQGAMLAAIDEELREDLETASQSSWQTLRPAGTEKQPRNQAAPKRRKLVRSRGPSMEFKFMGAKAEFDKYHAGGSLVNRTLVTVRDLEILDHIKTSTWKKFLTELRSDSRGNIRETGSNMVRVELRTIRPVAGDLSEEVRLRAKILPLRLYVDQDAVDFLKTFFSFKNPDSPEPEPDRTPKGTYFQLAEVFPIDLKLDYKPRRVDYKALKEGRTIELMNFFHFDGAEMTLRHITLSGITGWPRLFDLLNDLWTPDVKATQLAEVISGVAPIRSVVNVGSGMADLVLLPIAQYRKDGRIVRGVQKGATAFMKSTAMEAIKLGSRLATGTQVILEQAEGVLGNQFDQTLTAETVGGSFQELLFDDSDEEDIPGISKYAQQPADVKEGVQFAYRSLRKNLSSAAQTILAIPMEVYERSGNEGAVRSVIRAVPIAVLRPMIGASEAVSKTLQGLHNTLDPEVRHENEAKYKQR